MAIINPLPYTIANGDPVDATPVMADLNQIVADTNANAAPVAGSSSQEFLVATTTNPAGAVPLLQAQQQFAALGGSATEAFSASTVTATTVNTGTISGTSGSFSGAVSVGAAAASSSDAPQIQQTLGSGVGTYTEYTAFRAFSTTYTNNTGRPLVVCINMEMGSVPAGATANLYAYVSGTVLAAENSFTNGTAGTKNWNMGLMFIVPPTATYVVNANPSGGTATLYNWYEY